MARFLLVIFCLTLLGATWPPKDCYFGINVSDVTYWNGTAIPLNVYRLGGSPSCRCSDWSGSCTGSYTMDQDGWYNNLGSCDDGTGTEVPVRYIHKDSGNYPSGTWYVSCSGGGQIQLRGAGSATITCPATNVPVNVGSGFWIVETIQATPASYPKDIVVLPPGGVCGTSYSSYDPKSYCTSDADCTAPDTCQLFKDIYANSPSTLPSFWPKFLQFISNFDYLRWLGTARINDHYGVCVNDPNLRWCNGAASSDCGADGPCVTRWSERMTPTKAVWSGAIKPGGIPLEFIIEACNLVGKDCWFQIPHLADTDYVQQMASTIASNLDPNRLVIVEYSNEVWNAIFAQYKWHEGGHCTDTAAWCGADSDCPNGTCDKTAHYECPNAGGCNLPKEYTARAMELFDVFSQSFGDDSRILFVVGTQVANPWVARQIANYVHPTLGAFKDYKGSSSAPGDAEIAIGIAPYNWGCGTSSVSAPEDVPKVLMRGVQGCCSTTIDQSCLTDSDCPPGETCKGFPNLMKETFDEVVPLGIKLIWYEGGHHVVCGNTADPSACAAGMKLDAMEHVMFRYWRKAIMMGGVIGITQLGDVYPEGTTYNWGLKEYYDQPDSEAPKWRAVKKILTQWCHSSHSSGGVMGGGRR